MYHTEDTLLALKQQLPKKTKLNTMFKICSQKEPLPEKQTILDILFVLRKQSIAYSLAHNHHMYKRVPFYKQAGFIIIVPGFNET
ncbi:MAG: hypothetical protein HC896_07030 [Bacteroidales bacterium]|nr:hypothetical protein [Bacteroidales bacterium]